MLRCGRFRLLALIVSGIAVLSIGHAATAPVRAQKEAPPLVVFEALCRTLQENYPMLEYAGWSTTWIEEFRAKIGAADDRRTAFELMDQLVCRLNDYHTRFSWPGKPNIVSPPVRVLPVTTQAERLP